MCSYSSFQHFQQCLLNPFTGNISANVQALSLQDIQSKSTDKRGYHYIFIASKSSQLREINKKKQETFLVILSTSSMYTIPCCAA